MLKSNLLKQYHPNGMMKVISNLDSLASEICQKPLLEFSLEITVAPANKATTLRRGWTSQRTFSYM